MNTPLSPRIKALLALHFAVFLWGFTAILGKLITSNSFVLVWQRMTITAAVYLCLPPVWKHLKSMSINQILKFSGIGIIVLSHWITFYGSIKLGNSVSVTLACLGSASFFAAVIEPLLLNQPFSKRNLMMGLIVVLGIFVIYFSLATPENTPSTKHSITTTNYTLAIITGLISAALAATFTSLNKKFINNGHPLAISVIEMFSGALLLTIGFLLFNPSSLLFPDFHLGELTLKNVASGPWDLIWILILAVLCTNLTFYLGTYSLQQLSAFTSNLTVNLEPIYGIILGAIFFKENQQLGLQFYLGASLILGAIFTQAYLSYKEK
ncbi:MAG: DMT family transporter [Bacteroidota bacterium]|jgi:drug/metabolite transporter (DMT)-like permease